jgi:hypothetical protein
MAGSHAMTSLPMAVALHSGTTNATHIAIGAIGSAFFAVVLAYVVGLGVRKPWARPTEPSPSEKSVGDRSQSSLGWVGAR